MNLDGVHYTVGFINMHNFKKKKIDCNLKLFPLTHRKH